MIKKLLSLFLWLSIVVPGPVSALSLDDVRITDAALQQDARVLNISFSVLNTSDTAATLSYGVRLQESREDVVHEMPISPVVVPAQEQVVEYATMQVPDMLVDGEYDAFLLSRDAMGLVRVLKYLGEVTFETPTNHIVNNTLFTECVLIAWPTFECAVATSEEIVTFEYRVVEGSAYGTEVATGIMEHITIDDNNRVQFSLPTGLEHGIYTVLFWIGNERNMVDTVVDLGTPQSASFTKEQEERESTAFDKSEKTELVEMFGHYIVVVAVGLPMLLLLGILWVALRRPGVTKALMIGVFSLGAASGVYATMTLTDLSPAAYVFSGFSQDSENVQYSVTLDEASFGVSESIGLTAVMQETTPPNAKPIGGVLEVQVAGGDWETLIGTSDTSSMYHRTLSSIATAGTYTLNFRSPDLCGGAFYNTLRQVGSLFGQGIFGTTDCMFTMPLTIESPMPPTTPAISGACTVGEACTIGIVSTDPNKDAICYEAESPEDVFENAGCAASGNPVSIVRTFYTCNEEEARVLAQATDEGGLESSWGVGSPAIGGTISCVEPCAVCEYTGQDGVIAIHADPPFLTPDTMPVTISWDLENVRTCTIVGRAVEDGAVVVSWSWDTVRQNASQPVTLSEPTTFTLTCTDMDDATLQSSVTVNNAPTWQER